MKTVVKDMRHRGARILAFLLLLLAGLVAGDCAWAGNEKKVALVMKALSNPFFSKMAEGAKAHAARENIALEVFGMERETDIARQIGIVENLVARGYGAIVIAPADSRRLVPVCEKALSRGCVVINVDNPLDRQPLAEGGIEIPFVGSDNRAGAARVGAYVRRKLEDSGTVLVIEGISGVTNSEQRREGFTEAVTGGNIRVVASRSANWHTDEAFTVTAGLLAEHGPVDAIFCANDRMALGALEALELMDYKKRVLVAGYDNIPAVREALSAGFMDATLEQHPELMGRYGVDLAWRALNGERIPRKVDTPQDLVTREAFGKTVAFSVSTLSNPFFRGMVTGARKAAALFGVRFTVSDAKNDDARQLGELLALLGTGVDAVLLNPAGADAIVPGIELANGKGIPVITVDRTVPEGDILCHVASDNVEGGRMAARVLSSRLGGRGEVLEIEGIPEASVTHDRGTGFNRSVLAASGLSVAMRETAGFDREKAMRIVLRLLDRGDLPDGIFAHNDSMILGALDALEAQSVKRRPVLVGFDGIPEAKMAVAEGRIDATVGQRPEEMGREALRAAVRHFRGEKVPPAIPVALEMIGR